VVVITGVAWRVCVATVSQRHIATKSSRVLWGIVDVARHDADVICARSTYQICRSQHSSDSERELCLPAVGQHSGLTVFFPVKFQISSETSSVIEQDAFALQSPLDLIGPHARVGHRQTHTHTVRCRRKPRVNACLSCAVDKRGRLRAKASFENISPKIEKSSPIFWTRLA
jgi:hypothetical protein